MLQIYFEKQVKVRCLAFNLFTEPFLNRTLTTPVGLIKCLKAIRAHAFDVSDYPVVVTLEDHLTPDLQSKVAEVAFYFAFLSLLL